MEISAGTTADVNPEINIGKLLQMVKKDGLDKKAGLDKSASSEENADGVSSDPDNGSNFLQVLQQKLASLMESDNTKGAQALSAALEKLLNEDQTSGGESLSGLALLANAGKMDSPLAGENELSEESLSALAATKGLTSVLKREIGDPVDQTKPAMVENGKRISASKTIAGDVDEEGIQRKISPELNTKDTPKEAQLQNQADSSVKSMQASAMPGYVNVEGKSSAEGQKQAQTYQSVKENSAPQASPAVRQLTSEGQALQKSQLNVSQETKTEEKNLGPQNVKDPAVADVKKQNVIKVEVPLADKQASLSVDSSVKSMQASAMPDYVNVEGKSSAEGQKQAQTYQSVKENSAPQASPAVRQLTSEGQTLQSSSTANGEDPQNGYVDVQKRAVGENHNLKISAVAPANVQGSKSQLNVPQETKTEEKNLGPQNVKDPAGADVKKQNVIKVEVPLADKQASLSVDDARRNIGKVAVTLSEAAGPIDKVKPDFKSKTTPVEKNADMNSINATTISGSSSTKAEVSEVSPAQIINRVAAAFNETLASDGGRIKIILAPPSLGTLEMDVMVRNGTVKVMLTADNQDVQKMLSCNLDILKSSLQSQGLTIERCDVMMQDRREQYSQGFHQQAFNREQSSGQRDDRGETYHQDANTVSPLIIGSGHPSIGRSGNISIFA